MKSVSDRFGLVVPDGRSFRLPADDRIDPGSRACRLTLGKRTNCLKLGPGRIRGRDNSQRARFDQSPAANWLADSLQS
jgi:hypothetical protein